MTDGITKEEYAIIKAQVGSMEEKHFCPSCWTILWLGFSKKIYSTHFNLNNNPNPNTELLNSRYDNSLQSVSVQSSGENLPRFDVEFLGSDHQLSEKLLQKERWRQSRTGNVAFMLEMWAHVRLAKGRYNFNCSCLTVILQTMQLRSADEGQTCFYRCQKCQNIDKEDG